MSYKITINGGAAADLEGLSLAFTGLELVNMQPDVVNLRWTRERPAEACPVAHNDVVELYAGTRRIFHGRARPGVVANEGMPIKIVGPWSHLDEMTYQLSVLAGSIGTPTGKLLGETFLVTVPEDTVIWNGAAWVALPADHDITFTVATQSYYAGYPATTGTVDVNMSWTGRGYFFRPSFATIYTTIQDEWARLMSYVATVNDPDPFTVGTVALGNVVAPRARTFSDTLMSEAVRQVLAMKPDAAVWWDYATATPGTTPVLNAGVASLETPVGMVIGQQVLSDYKLKVADELVPAGVVVRWERDADRDTGLGLPFLADFFPGMEVLTGCDTTNASDTVTVPTTENLETGMMVTGTYVPLEATIDGILSGTTISLSAAATGTLAGDRMMFRKATGAASHQPGVLLHTVTDETLMVPGIAKEVYTSLATRRAQGTLTVVDEGFQMGLRPGMVMTLEGDAQLTGVQLWVQAVNWSPDTGLAQLTVGYPVHLQLRDRIDLKGWLKASFTGPFGQLASWVVPAP